jgi:plastocyanin
MNRIVAGTAALFAWPLVGTVVAQPGPAPIHRIFVSAVEFRGTTTRATLAPPPVDPAKASRGYEYKGPGDADPSNPDKWEVASYQFVPAAVVVPEGASVVLSVFIVNGDHHEVTLIAPDGHFLVSKVTWECGREYTMYFVASQIGTYRLNCATHDPTMTATITVLRR